MNFFIERNMYLFYHASKTATKQHVFLRPENSGTSHRWHWQWAVENAAANEASFVIRPAQCAMAQPSPYVTCSGGPDVPGSILSTGPDRRESQGPQPRQEDGYRQQFSTFFWLLLVHTAHSSKASNSDPSMRGALFGTIFFLPWLDRRLCVSCHRAPRYIVGRW